jgi:putative DNA primase/helicase
MRYLQTGNIKGYIRWLLSRPVNARGGDGGGKRKIVGRIKVARLTADSSINVLGVEQIRDKCRSEINEFVHIDVRKYWDAVSAYYPVQTDEFGNPIVPHPVPPRRMLAVSTGVGKSQGFIAETLDYIGAERAAGGDKAAYFAVPHHDLADELLERVMAQAIKSGRQIKVAVWKGMSQPDPVDPSETMCRRPQDLEIVHAYKLPVGTTLCASGSGENRTECKLAGICGYKRQVRDVADADIIILTHSMLTQRLPAALPEAGLLFVDEAAWQIMTGGCDTPVRITATALRKAGKNTPELDWAKRRLAELLDGPTPEPDGGIKGDLLLALRQSMGSMGITPADAAKLEWDNAGKLSINVVDYSGDDLEAALKRELGDASGIKAARQMASLWRAVDDAQLLPAGSRSGRLDIFTPKGEAAVREIKVRWKEELSEGWSKVPILFADATADATVLQACFDGIVPSPRYVSHSPHVKIRQIVDRSMSHAAIAPKSEDDLAKASDAQKANAKTARSNAQKVKAKLIADALHRYRGKPVVAVVPAATEAVWREDPIPSWLSILHYGNVTGLDDYGTCRAVYVVGRTLPSSSAVEAYAGTLTGVEPSQKGYRETRRELVCADGSGVVVTAWEHPDPLCEAIRRQVTEAGIIQAAGRGRGINRSADKPLDIALWTDVAVPELGLVEAETWEAPSIEAEMLAAGCWIDLPSDAARIHPEIVKSPDSLKKARQRRIRDSSLLETPISKCPSSSFRYRPSVSGRRDIGSAVFLNAVSEAEARTYLEARLGPLALLERVQPASDMSEAIQTPIPATQEAAGPPIDLPAARSLIEIGPAFSVDLKPSETYPETFDLSTYRGGIMPGPVIVQSRALQKSLGLTQEAFADLIGISRPHLANAQAGRFPLSEAAAFRIVSLLLAPPPIRQPDLFAIQ